MTSEATHLQNRRISKGRHPLLGIGMLTGDVYRHLKMHPGETIAQIHSTLKGNRQSINGALQRLKKEALVEQKPVEKGNRVIYPYYIVLENETSYERDRVEIETVIMVNAFGEYSVVSKVVGELPGARISAGLHEVHRTKHYVVVPRPSEPYRTRVPLDTGSLDDGLIIDVTPD